MDSDEVEPDPDKLPDEEKDWRLAKVQFENQMRECGIDNDIPTEEQKIPKRVAFTKKMIRQCRDDQQHPPWRRKSGAQETIDGRFHREGVKNQAWVVKKRHTNEEVRSTPEWQRLNPFAGSSDVCKFHGSIKGCKYGDRCWFVHYATWQEAYDHRLEDSQMASYAERVLGKKVEDRKMLARKSFFSRGRGPRE